MIDIFSFFPSVDIGIAVFFVGVLFLHFLFVSPAKLVTDIFAVYIGFFLTLLLEYLLPEVAEWLGAFPFGYMVFFVATVVLFHTVFWKSNLSTFSRHVAPIDVAVSLAYRVSIIGLFFATAIYFSPAVFRATLGPVSLLFFATLPALFCWAIVPLFLAFAYRYKAKNGWIE